MAYHQTALVKSIKCNKQYCRIEIKKDEIIPPRYLICIILYTDFTELFADFSSTFRSKHKYEAFTSIKKRNEKYFWLSKGLKEMIEHYGQSQYEGIGLLPKLRGPFYTGMSIVLKIDQFVMTLIDPTSTTIHKEVATRFGGEDGMLIQFDNSTGDGRFVNGFDVSWISRYGLQEDERYR